MKSECKSIFIYYCFSHNDLMIEPNQILTYYKDSNCDTEFVTEAIFIDGSYQILKLKTEIETHFKKIGYIFDFDCLLRLLNEYIYTI
jgi:hypothetical protein